MDFIYEENRITLSESNDATFAEVSFPGVDTDTANTGHTFVDNSLGGQGITGKLVKAAAEQFRETDKEAVLTCPYAAKWLEEHPEYSSVVKG